MFERMRMVEKVDAEPNLIPVMNLFVAMIPFLLLAVAFFQLGVIPTTLPTHTESSDVEVNTKAVTVSIVVNREGFDITVMNQNLPENVLARFAKTIPKDSGQYDYDGLRDWLQSIKQSYQSSDTVVMLPTERVRYGELVRIMDIVRYEVSTEANRDKQAPFFPNVVLSRIRES